MSPTLRTAPLLGLIPLLACSDLLVKAIAIAVAGLVLMSLCGAALLPLRRWLQGKALALAALLLSALLIGIVDLLLQLLSSELHTVLAAWLPLLALPALALAQDEQPSAASGLRAGLIFAALALTLGLLREPLGSGSLFARMDWLFGQTANAWKLSLHGFSGIGLLNYAPGALILLGLLLAARRLFSNSPNESP